MEPIYYILIAISVSITLYILGRHWYRNYMRIKEAREYLEASQLISGYGGKYTRPKEVIKERPGIDRVYSIPVSPGWMEEPEILKEEEFRRDKAVSMVDVMRPWAREQMRIVHDQEYLTHTDDPQQNSSDSQETNFGGGSFGGGGAEGTWVDSPSVDCGGDVGG